MGAPPEGDPVTSSEPRPEPPPLPPPGSPRPDQLAVARLHEGLVLDALAALEPAVPARVLDRDGTLELSLLGVDPGALQAFAAARRDAGHGPLALDVVLGVLREGFRSRYGGWVPTMGKNRAVTRVTHNIGGGDEGPPRPARALDLTRPSRSGRVVTVGVADTAVHPHRALTGAVLAPGDALLGQPDPSTHYAAGHGTFVTGAVLLEAPDARIEAVRALGEDGTADSWDVARQLVALARTGVDVLNMSFGCFTDDDRPPLVLATAVDRLDAQTVLVAASGNHGNAPDGDGRRPLWPAALDDVVAVGATDSGGGAVGWSQPPDEAPWIDVLARGVDVVSTYLPGSLRVPADTRFDRAGGTVGPFDSGWASWSGTSFAAARFSGALARLVSAGLEPREALAALLEPPGTGEGHGLPRRQGRPWLA